ncbi:hypothetical protein [Cryobacterium sp. MLB-32]|uniref:hypothetical protein n=1 Tax=Cryobacterium sp. MLB-32 TaxID=1529318 RepID=UPI0012E01E27|nr:hypothetical protein [Cryobacterium sp. MLB-32]
MEALRWALGAHLDIGRPVSLRNAQHWAARMESVGLVGRSRPTFRDGSIVWPTPQAAGKQPPNLFRQTTRHEVAVATVSARYVAQGFTWRRDRRPAGLLDHQVDGVAQRGRVVELVEVELTPKTWQRYKLICENHAFRLAHEGVTQISYFCTSDADRAITREADKFIFRTERQSLVSRHAFDPRGRWVGPELEDRPHLTGVGPASIETELDGVRVWGGTATARA